MRNHEATLAVIDALESVGIPYMIVGSLSSNLYGVERSTRDADVVIELGRHSIGEVAQRLGPELRLDQQMGFETVTATHKYLFHLHGSPFRIEIFLLSEDPHDQTRFRRRRAEVMPQYGRSIFVPTPEDVIIMKLRWSRQGQRSKDVDDARNVLAVQGDALDWDYIHTWCERHGTKSLLDEVRRSIPRID